MALQTAEPLETPFDARAVLATYRTSSNRLAVIQLVNTLVPFVLLWITMWYSLRYSYAVTLLLSLPMAGLLLRIYVLQHDCGHGSMFSTKRLNDLVGRFLAVLVYTPFLTWKSQHAQHHATSGNLDRRGIGDILILTVREYRQLSPWGRFVYRVQRHPLYLFGIAPVVYFVVVQRFTFGLPSHWRQERASVHWTTLGVVSWISGMCWLVGWQEFIMIQLPATAIASSAGVWLFYMQHNFPDTYWERHEDWDYTTAALTGSSFYHLPRALHWFSANIGFHHIHHLDSRIPNYRLQECYESHPELQQAPQLTLWQSLSCISVRLWDEEQRRMVTFGEAAKSKPAADRAADRADVA